MTFPPGLVAAGPLPISEGEPPPPPPPPPPEFANIAYICYTTSHGSYTNTVAALTGLGHTVTPILDVSLPEVPDFSAYDLVMLVRVRSTTTTTATRVRAGLLAHSKPSWWSNVDEGIMAGGGRQTIAYHAKLWSLSTADSAVTHLVVVNTSHAMWTGLAAGNLAVYPSNNYVAVAEGVVPGTRLLQHAASNAALVAIEAGQNDLNGVPLPARTLVGGFPYAGQSAYTAAGVDIIDRGIEWLLGTR